MSRDALVVGINKYQDDNLRNLKAPAEDAEALALMLEEYGEFQVWRFPEAIGANTRKPYVAKTKEFSLSDLEDALVKLFKPEGRQVPDTALFYFSGHGLRKNKGVQEGYLATSDVNSSLSFYGLSLQWLRRLLQESPIRQQIIWLDCCHSGELLNFNEADPGEQGQARDRCFIGASREFEPAYQSLGSDYSVLTKVLLEGLDPNRCPQKWITTISLTDFINEHLRHENQRPVFTNFGSPINLTRTLDTPIPVSKGEDSQDICPYKGLEYFDCNDEDPKYFYGRETLTDKLIDRVRQSNFLAILGASGSGKSSVLRAGLLHQLKLGRKLADSQDWKIQIMLPGEHPLQNLALSWLEPDLSVADRATELDKIKSLLQKGSEGLLTLVQASTAKRVVLVIDQFEEAFTLCQDLEEREAFFQCLLEALEQTDNRLCLIIAMRADFFSKCIEAKYSGLSQKIQANLITIPPMEREELRQAIIKPAEKVNLSLESGLAETILKDVQGSPGSLPLLEDTLSELWKRRKDNQLKLTAYVQIGGIGGTLDRRATEVYEGLSQPEQNAAKHIFLSLTTLGERTEDTRRRVLKQDLVTRKHDEQLIDSVVQKLAQARLIVTRDRVEPSSEIGKQAEIDVAHEALIRYWQQLQSWLEENREALRKKQKIEDEAKSWEKHANKKDYVWKGYRLAEAEKVLQEYAGQVTLSTLAQEFLEESRREELGDYLLEPACDDLDQTRLEEEAEVKSFLSKTRLWNLLKDERKKAKVRLAASWVLKQWGEEVPMWLAEIEEEEEEKISLYRVEPPPTVVEDLGNGISLELVEIPRGEFWMGASEEEEAYREEFPQHKVRVSTFLMGKYPVTQEQWQAIASLPEVERELSLEPSYHQNDNRPVESVSWDDAVEFCQRLSRETGKKYRLPSEAEWEYACRGGTTTAYHFGKKILPSVANYGQTGRGKTTPVGRFQVANALGLYDLYGNVYEWCEDNWHDSYDGAPRDGRAWIRRGRWWSRNKASNIKVIRGGSWIDYSDYCRSAYRNYFVRDGRYDDIGFRVVCVAPRTT